MGDAGQQLDLGLVGKEDVDPAPVEQLVETVAVSIDAEDVGQGEGDLSSRFARDLDCPDHRVTRRFRIPQIAFEVEDRRGADLLLVKRG